MVAIVAAADYLLFSGLPPDVGKEGLAVHGLLGILILLLLQWLFF